MKKIFSKQSFMRAAMMLLTTLLLTLTAQPAWATIGGTGTQSDPYTINSTDDWNTFASNVANGTTYQDKFMKLTADISVTTMVGTSEHTFKGKFNGGGHILTIAYGTSDSYFDEDFVAPFRYVDGADFRFLQVSGEIYTSQGYAAGLVAYANSDNTFFHCISDVIIRSSVDGDGNHGGFVGKAFGSDYSLTFTNCLSKANISGDNLTGCAGFVGWHEGRAVFRNCYFNGNVSKRDNSQNFARNGASISKCYSEQAIPKAGNSQGTYRGMLNDNELLSGLGAGWEKKNGAIVPILDGDNLATCNIIGLHNVYLWNGSVISITYSVSALDGSQLIKGTHYEAIITKDESESEVKDKGTYTLTLTGKNGYTGSKSVNFTVSDCPEGLSVDDDYQSDQTGYYYVNMPSGSDNTKTITIPDGFKSCFKVYDDGGKNGEYTIYGDRGFRRVMVIEAPQGYKIQLTGTVRIYERNNLLYARLKIYNGTSSDLGTTIGNERYGDNSHSGEDIGLLVSEGENVTLVFSGYEMNSSNSGLDLTVKLINTQESHNIIINTATGGSVASDINTAKVDDIVTLTATPANNTYKLNSIIVTDADNNTIPLSNGMCWYSGTNTANFSMPGSAVTVTPVFTNNWTATEGGLSITMPTKGNIDASHIPSAIQSFKVSYNQTLVTGTSTLKLSVPDGYLMELSGKVKFSLASMDGSNPKSSFYVYDGEDNSANKLIDLSTNYSVNNNYTALISTGQSLYIYCESQIDTYWTVDLTITLISNSVSHAVTISNSISHGQVASDLSTAVPNSDITLTVTPDEGYVLQRINVVDSDGNVSLTPSSTDAVWGDVDYYTDNEFTFKMRLSNATVNAIFMAKKDFYVKMPKTGQREFTIPAGTTAFKVYDSGGLNGDYGINENGDLLLTAPEGYVMNIKGSGTLRYYRQFHASAVLRLYNGNSNNSENMGEYTCVVQYSGDQMDETSVFSVDKTSSSNQLLIHLETPTGDQNYGDSFEFTVTLVPVLSEANGITAAIATQIAGKKAQFTRSFTENVASTVCLPFDHTPASTVGSFYEFVEVDMTGSDWVVTMQDANVTTDNPLKAHKPYLFKPAATAPVTFYGTVPNDVTTTAGTKTVGDWTFTGTYAEHRWTTDPKSIYVFATTANTDKAISPGDFIRISGGDKSGISPFRAYLNYDVASPARGVTSGAAVVLPERMTVRLIGRDGTPTAIGSLDMRTGEVTFDNEWYSLDGHRLEGKPTKKGLYINNGKKVAIK